MIELSRILDLIQKLVISHGDAISFLAEIAKDHESRIDFLEKK